MSAKTKIVVLHRKELISAGIFAALGILFLVLLIILLLPGKDPADGISGNDTAEDNITASASTQLYIPGIYTTELVLGGQTVEVEVIVEENTITSVNMVPLSDAVTTMYPLLQPTFDSVCEQICRLQSLEGITYTSDSKYTTLVILEAIQSALKKASLTENSLLQTTSGSATGTKKAVGTE